MLKRILLYLILFSASCISYHAAVAQKPGWTFELLDSTKRSEKFEERKLGSEKMADKKFTIVRRVIQNNFTHYNYYFNANNKINTILERAKASQQDDYTKLLSYYPYTLENTASQKTELDSVILKATAGILLHDLRNDWIDNMYLLMGKAYFLRKDFDTAAATFQFINYNLFPRKKKEEDSRIVGTTSDATKNAISIANKEKTNILKKVTALPPSRNDALIWMARTLIEQGEMSDAASLIHTLQLDPNLPKRLINDLDDVNAYWFYKEGIFDSTASYLEKALTNSDNKQDKARSEFLLGQLYEQNRLFEKATIFYERASLHTTNPLLDIYAQLNNAKMRKGNNPKELERGIDNLVKLSKKDNFEKYREIIFYSAGELAMEKTDTTQGIQFFTKSYKTNENNVVYKNKAFLKLADIAYNRKQYQLAFNFYDSLQSGDTTLTDQLPQIQARRNALSKIVEKIIIIERQDSLQRIAALDPAAREAFVRKLSKKLRKEKGLKAEDSNFDSGPMLDFGNKKDEPADLFQNNNKTGEWYFYNSGLKSKGYSEFKRKWGTRPNADNWRRKSAAVDQTPKIQEDIRSMTNMNPDDADADVSIANTDDKKGKGGSNLKMHSNGKPVVPDLNEEDISFEGLMSRLPITPEKLSESNTFLSASLFELAKLYQEELEDYQEAILTYDKSLQRYPDSLHDGEIYFGLFYCYNKLGNTAKANYYKNLLASNFSNSKSNKILTNPASAKPADKDAAGTKRYEVIYNYFIEGRFEEAIAEKKKADSLYGKNYWSPQLLYIEAVYHVKQKNDSLAIDVLNNIIMLYPSSALKAKAERMIAVLKRRKEIETYLSQLQITRYKEDEIVVTRERVKMVRNDSTLVKPAARFIDSSNTILKPIAGTAPVIKDSVLKSTKNISGTYVFNYTTQHSVILLLDKVDGTYVNESKNAMARYASDNFRQLSLNISKDILEKDISMVIFTPFATAEDALQFLLKARKAAPDEISWLPANKYSFILIDDDNLTRMKNSKDIIGYKALLQKQFPGLF